MKTIAMGGKTPPILFLLLIAFLSANFAFTQDIVLSNLYDILPDSYVKMTSIDSQAGKILDTKDTNIISSNAYFFDGDIYFSALGNIMINKFNSKNDIYENIDTQFQKIYPPIQHGLDSAYSSVYVSPWESILIERTYQQNEQKTNYKFYDLIKNATLAEYSVPQNLGGIKQMNEDASACLIAEPSGWIRIVERKENEFIEFPTNISTGLNYVHLSKDGKRIVYRRFLGKYSILSYMDRLTDGWSEPIDIPLKDKDGNDIIFRLGTEGAIYDIANNGKTILFNHFYGWAPPTLHEFDAFYSDPIYKPAIMYEENGVWSEPEFIDYERHQVDPKYDEGQGERFFISEDGNVIAVQNLVKVWGGNSYYYEIYVLLKSPEGKWTRQNINPEGTLVAPDIYLSKDGSKLFWLPTDLPGSVPSSVPNAMQY